MKRLLILISVLFLYTDIWACFKCAKEDYTLSLNVEESRDLSLLFQSIKEKDSSFIWLSDKKGTILTYTLEKAEKTIDLHSNNDYAIKLIEDAGALIAIEVRKEDNPSFIYKIEEVDGVFKFTEWPKGSEKPKSGIKGIEDEFQGFQQTQIDNKSGDDNSE